MKLRNLPYEKTKVGEAALVAARLGRVGRDGRVNLDPPDSDVFVSQWRREPCVICRRPTPFEVLPGGDPGTDIARKGGAVCSQRCKKKFLLRRFEQGSLRPGHGAVPDDRFDVKATDVDGYSVTKITKDMKP